MHSCHGHPHPRPTGRPRRAGRMLAVALLATGSFMLVEAIAGWWADSLALLSDASHMLGDVTALALALGAAALARRPPTLSRSFGFIRAEVLGGLLNAASLIVLCILILREALERIAGPPRPVDALVVLGVGSLGLVLNLGIAAGLRGHSHESVNTRAAYLHVVADALGSVGAILAAGLMLGFGVTWADPVISVVIAALVLWSAWPPLRDALRVLLQFAPAATLMPAVEKDLLAVEGVRGVHELHVWTIDGREGIASVHVVVPPEENAALVRRRVEDVLATHHGLHHTTVQVESEGHDLCHQQTCPILRDEPAVEVAKDATGA